MSVLNINSYLVYRRLQVASCCAAGKGIDYMDLLRDGVNCSEILTDCDRITALINSMLCYARIYTNASVTATALIASNTPTTTNIIVGGVTIATVTYTTGSTTVIANTIIAAVNAATSTFGFTAAIGLTANSFIISSRDGSVSNGLTFSITTTAGTFSSGTQLAGGTDYLQANAGITCISPAQINGILDKLSQLCGCACNQYVTYEKPN